MDSLKKKPDDVVRNIRRSGKHMYYDIRGTRRSDNEVGRDYLKVLSTSGSGLTRIGQLLFQESSQAYVYCILGSQAKTRWKIIGDGANSLQTQRVFRDLIDEVVTQKNLSTLIKLMRVAISATRVRLDYCISPGLELIPSDMVYIKDSPGYNNILRVSSLEQRFGINNVNRMLLSVSGSNDNIDEKGNPLIPGVHRIHGVHKIPGVQNTTQSSHEEVPKTDNTTVLGTGLFIAILARVIWVALI